MVRLKWIEMVWLKYKQRSRSEPDHIQPLSWPPILSKRSEGWVYGLSGIISLAGVLIGQTSGRVKFAFGAIAIVAFLLGMCIFIARAERAKYMKRIEVSGAEAKDREWLSILEDRVHPLLLQVVRVVATEDPVTRRDRASSARTAIVNLAAADVIGPSERVARLNLFKIHGTGSSLTMETEPFCSSGRGKASDRSFKHDDDTTVVTLQGGSRFVHCVKDELDDPEEDLAYDTFATTAVGVPDGQIWGALTADCVRSGELDEARDVTLMGIFAAMIAVTYACEIYPKPREKTGK